MCEYEASARPLEYWNVNVSSLEQTRRCPSFLAQASAKDRAILATRDADFQRMNWNEVVDLVHTNRLDLFRRVPSDLRRYLAYTSWLAEQYGSVMIFVLSERLKWEMTDLQSMRDPLSQEEDDTPLTTEGIKILRNDWPYGLALEIVHLVVWTKSTFEEDPTSPDGDLSPRARSLIEAFVQRTFAACVGHENVLWFKNWRSLKSVQAVEHFHVLLRSPDPEFVREITHDDVPLCEKLNQMPSLNAI